jgi:hypothetical protein
MSERRLEAVEALEAENARLRAAVETALVLLEENIASETFNTEGQTVVALLRDALDPDAEP